MNAARTYDEVAERHAMAPDATLRWPVYWSAIWVGALTAIAVALIIGLMGISLGAHQVGPARAARGGFGLGALIFSVLGAFLAFAAGGWVTAKIAALRRAETAMLHGG